MPYMYKDEEVIINTQKKHERNPFQCNNLYGKNKIKNTSLTPYFLFFFGAHREVA